VELYYHQEADVAQNKRLAALAEVCGLPVVAGGSVHYLRPPDARAYAVLESIRTLTLTHEPAPGKRGNPSARHAFLTPGKAVRFFSQYPGAVENTQRISDACELIQRLVDAV
jgi:DNA polymerase III alpha subunit